MTDPRIHGLYRDLVQKRIDRRGFLRGAAALGVSASAASLFLKAEAARAQAPSAPPIVATPATDGGAYKGVELTIQVIDASIKQPLDEVRAEYEAATGAKVNIVADPIETAFSKLLEDASTGTNSIDGSVVGMWWLGELVAGEYLMPYDDLYADTSGKFPKFDFDADLPAIKALHMYDGKKYVFPYDADGQALYYRRDLLTDQAHMDAYKAETGKDLGVPTTWDELYEIANHFKNSGAKALDGSTPLDGITMHLKVGGQGPFHYWSLSAPYVIGPENKNTYWFDPDTMDPLLNSPGHVAAAEMIKKLFDLGPQAQAGWALGESWDHFLKGNAVFTFSWGDVLPLAYQNNSPTKGKIGTAQLPGTMKYTNPQTKQEYPTDAPNIVGNTTGGSWAGVIMKGTKNPEAVYYFFALLATEPKERFYAARGSDGVDPGKYYQIPPEATPEGKGSLEDYTSQGWVPDDAIQYTKAYYDTFQNPLQLPYLRIPGTDEYRNAMDIRMSEFFTGQVATAQEAMDNLVNDMKDITDRLGLDAQKEVYRKSLGL